MIFMDLESLPTHRRTSCSVLVADAFVKCVFRTQSLEMYL